MATNGAPNNWDETEEISDEVAAKLTLNPELNVNAASFVPNVNAAPFVPSWGPGEGKEPAESNQDNGEMVVDEDTSPVENGPAKPADSWEDKADMSSAATTPEDEDMSMEDDSGSFTIIPSDNSELV